MELQAGETVTVGSVADRATITLSRDLPGCPAGTVFALDRDGNYRDQSGKHWLSPRAVAEMPGLVVPPPVEQGTAYHYIDDAGAVMTAAWEGTKRDEARKTVGNYFERPEDAKLAATKTAEALGGKALTDAAEAEVIAEKATVADSETVKG